MRRWSNVMCDLNHASVEQIETLMGIDRDRALGLALWRPYASWTEVETVPGFDRRNVDALQAAGAVLSPVETPAWPPAGGELAPGGQRRH